MSNSITETLPTRQANEIKNIASKISDSGAEKVTGDELIIGAVEALIEADINFELIANKEDLKEVIFERLQAGKNIML